MSDSESVSDIEYPRPFDTYAISLCQSASRTICILSPRLDPAAFDNAELATALSTLARASRQTQVRILIKDSRPLVGRGHRLLELARRLTSAVHIRKLPEHPNWNTETVVIKDRDGVLFTLDGNDHEAFYEPDSRASVLSHLELFEELWRYSIEDTELRSLRL